MINALIKIIAINQGINWWCITNRYLYGEIYNILDWNDVIYTKNNEGIWFEYELENVNIQDTIKMLEKLRILFGQKNWPKIKNTIKNKALIL